MTDVAKAKAAREPDCIGAEYVDRTDLHDLLYFKSDRGTPIKDNTIRGIALHLLAQRTVLEQTLATERAERCNYLNEDGDLVVNSKTLFRQVGWHGQSGGFYPRSRPPQRVEEPGSYAPVYEQIATWVDGEGWHD